MKRKMAAAEGKGLFGWVWFGCSLSNEVLSEYNEKQKQLLNFRTFRAFQKSVCRQDWCVFPEESVRGLRVNAPCTAQATERLAVRDRTRPVDFIYQI